MRIFFKHEAQNIVETFKDSTTIRSLRCVSNEWEEKQTYEAELSPSYRVFRSTRASSFLIRCLLFLAYTRGICPSRFQPPSLLYLLSLSRTAPFLFWPLVLSQVFAGGYCFSARRRITRKARAFSLAALDQWRGVDNFLWRYFSSRSVAILLSVTGAAPSLIRHCFLCTYTREKYTFFLTLIHISQSGTFLRLLARSSASLSLSLSISCIVHIFLSYPSFSLGIPCLARVLFRLHSILVEQIFSADPSTCSYTKSERKGE